MSTTITDNTYIKHLKPKKNSRYHQGYVDTSSCKKLYESCKRERIIYRSGLELQFIQFCENNAKIIRWGSEPIAIPYFNRLKNKNATYYPDYVITLLKTDKEHNNYVERCIIEIKPYNQTIKPREQDSRWLKETWVVNVDKWNAAKRFAESHDMKFMIITEKFFNF